MRNAQHRPLDAEADPRLAARDGFLTKENFSWQVSRLTSRVPPLSANTSAAARREHS